MVSNPRVCHMTRVYSTLIGIFMIYYCWVAWIALHPDVTPEYCAYYITRESSISPQMERGTRPIRLFEQLTPDDPRLIFHRWSPPETTFRWSDGPLGTIVFTLQRAVVELAEGRIVLSIGTNGPQRVKVSLNGKPMVDRAAGNNTVIELNFDPRLLNVGKNHLDFRFPDAKRPGNGDPRQLAIFIRSLKIF